MVIGIGLLVVFLTAFATVDYCKDIIRHKIQPRLATWILFVVGSGLSLGTYVSTRGEHSFFANAANVVDVAMSLIVLAVLSIFKSVEHRFTKFDKRCLLAAGIILIGWILSREHFMANITAQVLLTVSYLPTIHGLWRASRNTESYGPWVIMLAIGCLSVIGALVKHDVLGVLYAGRLITCVSSVIVLQYRLDLRDRRNIRKINP